MWQKQVNLRSKFIVPVWNSYTAHPMLLFSVLLTASIFHSAACLFSHPMCTVVFSLPSCSLPLPQKNLLHGNFGECIQLLFSALLQLDLLHYQCWGGRGGEEGRAEVGFMHVDEERGRREWQRGCWGRENYRGWWLLALKQNAEWQHCW